MSTLIKHVTALTLDEADTILQDIEIALAGSTIVAVGKAPADFAPDEIINGRDLLALPAFFNAHTHAAMTLERGWAEDLPFDRWLNEKIWVAESALEEEDVAWGTALAAAEMLRSGTVGFADHEQSGMKALLAWCHFGLGAEKEVGQIPFAETVAFAERWQDAAGGRIHTTMGPHSPYMAPPEVLARFAREAQRLGVGAHFHLSESEEQLRNSIARYGKTPTAHVAALGLFDLPQPALVAHCNVVTDDDLALMLEHGVKVALATDGPASNSDLNMLEVMRITGLYQKGALGDPEALPLTQLLRLATQSPAAALGFSQSGVLAPGHPADLILVDTTAPHWIPRHDSAAGIVYTAHPGDVAYVWCDGQLLYRQGEYLTLDIERIRWEAEKRAFRMVGRPMTSMRAYQG
jgi:5-methylthioadenosine/S-adenosylhomocysteine deaminase